MKNLKKIILWFILLFKGGAKIVSLKAASADDVKKYISRIDASNFNNGDRAEVTYIDGSKQIFIFRKNWEKEE